MRYIMILIFLVVLIWVLVHTYTYGMLLSKMVGFKDFNELFWLTIIMGLLKYAIEEFKD